MAKRTWEPKGYPVRDPRTTTQVVGRMVNPPRALKFGGRGEMTILPMHKTRPGETIDEAGIKPVSDRGRGGRNPI